MIAPTLRSAIVALAERGYSKRRIAISLRTNRTTVRRVLAAAAARQGLAA